MSNKLSKKVFVKELQENLKKYGIELNQKQAAFVFDAYGETVLEATLACVDGGYDSVGLGFGTIKVAEVPARTGVSPLDGSEWTSPAHKRASLKFAQGLRNELKAKSAQ